MFSSFSGCIDFFYIKFFMNLLLQIILLQNDDSQAISGFFFHRSLQMTGFIAPH